MTKSIGMPGDSPLFALPSLEPLQTFMRTASQKVATAALRVLHLDPAELYQPYRLEQQQLIAKFADEINGFWGNDEASQQHIFARLAKDLSYCDFSVLTPEQKQNFSLEIPINGQRITYHFDRSLSLAGFCDATILTAEGAPPIFLVPGTFPRLDNPGKFWETLGANLQGSAWKVVADDLLRKALPLFNKVEGQPSAFLIGHSAGASAIRQLLSRYKGRPKAQKSALLHASFHAFNPPATSTKRADIIDAIKRPPTSQGDFTSYIEARDPVSHMGGVKQAGRILVAPLDDRSARLSHARAPKASFQGYLITPYAASKWTLHRGLSRSSLALIAIINLCGVNTLISTIKPIISDFFCLISRLLGTAALLVAATFALESKKISKIIRKSEIDRVTEKFLKDIVFAPVYFVYAYWNKAIAPALYAATGREYYLRSKMLDIR